MHCIENIQHSSHTEIETYETTSGRAIEVIDRQHICRCATANCTYEMESESFSRNNVDGEEREESAGSTVSQSAQLGSINSKYHLSVRVANKKTEGNTLSPIYHKAQCYGTKRHTRLNEYRHPSPTANLKQAQFSIDMQFFSA